MADTSSLIPRLGMADLDPGLAATLRPRVDRLGYLGEFFQCAAHQPEALRHFVAFTEAAKDGIDERMVEVVALTAAAWLGNRYERHQHERLSVRLGFGRPWVAAVLWGAGQAVVPADDEAPASLTEEEQAVQRLALAVLDGSPVGRGPSVAPALERVATLLGPAAAVGVLLVVGRYLAHAAFVNALGIEPPVPSIFEDGFGHA